MKPSRAAGGPAISTTNWKHCTRLSKTPIGRTKWTGRWSASDRMKGRSALDEAIAGSGRAGDLHHELEALHQALEDPHRAHEMDRTLERFRSDEGPVGAG